MSSVESVSDEHITTSEVEDTINRAASSSSSVQLSTIRKHGIIKVLDLFNSKYDCKVCRKKLRYKADEIIHLELKHKNENKNKTIKCPYCAKFIPTYFQLTRHLMIKHLNEKPYGCRLCKKKFFAFITLKQHCLKHHILNHNQQIDENNNNLDASKYSPITCLSSDTTSSSSFKSLHSLQDLIEYDNSNLTYELDDLIDMNDIDQDDDEEEDEIDVIKIDDHDDEVSSSSSDFHTLPECNFQTLEFTLITNFNYQQCTKCSILFKSSSDYLIHCWNEHMNNYKESYFCWMCQKNPSHNMDCETEFDSDQELKRHLLAEHLDEEYEFKCSMCKNNDQVFLDLDEAHTHFFSAHQHKTFPLHLALCIKFSCFNCEQVFDSLEHIQAHFITKCSLYERKSLIKCNLDSLVFNSQMAYEIHLNQHCCLDNTSTASRSLLYRKTPIFKPISKTASKKSLVVTVPLTLESPNLSVPTPPLPSPPTQQSIIMSILSEERTNRSSRQFKCDYCEHCEFATSSELGEHILLHGSSNTRRPFKCHLCQVTFVKVEQLKRHMIVHQAGDFVCPTCFSSFSRRQDLDRHSLFHNK